MFCQITNEHTDEMGICTSISEEEIETFCLEQYYDDKKTKQSFSDTLLGQLDKIISEIKNNNIGWCNYQLLVLTEQLDTWHYRYILRHIRLVDVLYDNITSDIPSFIKHFVSSLDSNYITRHKVKFHEILTEHPTIFTSFLDNHLVTQQFLIYRIKNGYNILSPVEDFKLIIEQELFPDELFASDFHYFDGYIVEEMMALIYNYSYLARRTLYSQMFNFGTINTMAFYKVFRANETLTSEFLTKTSSKGRSVLSNFMEVLPNELIEEGIVTTDLIIRARLYDEHSSFYHIINLYLNNNLITEEIFDELTKIENIKAAVIHCYEDTLITYLDNFGETAKSTVIIPTLINILPELVSRTDISIGYKLGLLERNGYLSNAFVASIINSDFYLFTIETTQMPEWFKYKLLRELGMCRSMKDTAIFSKCAQFTTEYTIRYKSEC